MDVEQRRKHLIDRFLEARKQREQRYRTKPIPGDYLTPVYVAMSFLHAVPSVKPVSYTVFDDGLRCLIVSADAVIGEERDRVEKGEFVAVTQRLGYRVIRRRTEAQWISHSYVVTAANVHNLLAGD